MTAGFNSDKMYTYVKGYAMALGWNDCLQALSFARAKHSAQRRKGGEPYAVHPLTMACHALALDVKDEVVVATALLHDVCEDCGVTPDDLPVSNPAIKDAVRRLTHVKPEPLELYYAQIADNPYSSLVKLFDRCDNVSTMAGVFSTGKTMDYIDETRTHVVPLFRSTKASWPQYSDAIFVLKYHVLSVINGIEACIPTAGQEEKK